MNEMFYTFPVSVFSLPADEKEIVEHIISSAIHRAGSSDAAETIGEDQIIKAVKSKGTSGYNRSEQHDQIMRGMIVLGFTKGHLPTEAKRCNEVAKINLAMESKFGQMPKVFVSKKLFDEYPDNLNFRELSTLCAINSIIGLKRTKYPVIIRRTLIQARQIGFKTPAAMQTALNGRMSRPPLTTQQTRDTLDSLELRGLISRCQPKPRSRTVYFSTGLKPAELREAVKKNLDAKRTVIKNREDDRNYFDNQSETR